MNKKIKIPRLQVEADIYIIQTCIHKYWRKHHPYNENGMNEYEDGSSFKQHYPNNPLAPILDKISLAVSGFGDSAYFSDRIGDTKKIRCKLSRVSKYVDDLENVVDSIEQIISDAQYDVK